MPKFQVDDVIQNTSGDLKILSIITKVYKQTYHFRVLSTNFHNYELIETFDLIDSNCELVTDVFKGISKF